MKISIPAMDRRLRIVLIAVASLAALIVVLPFVVPTGVYRDRIESAADHATGRLLKIEGPLRLMLFPHFGLRAHDVTFANMPGGRASAMATAGEISISVRVLPLLTGHIVLDKIILDRPVIALEVNKQGAANWTFAKAGRPTQAEGAKSPVTLPIDTQFSGIEIDDGRVTYDNAKTGTHRSIDHVDARIAVTRLDRPITIDGDLTVGGGKLDFTARIATLKDLLGNGRTAVDLSVSSENLLHAGFKGRLEPDGGADGVFKLDTSDFREVAGWFGEELPTGGGPMKLSLQCRFVSQDKVSTLSPLGVSLDNQHIGGKLTLDRRGRIPVLEGALTADRLDLNPYLTSGHKGRPAAGNAESGWSKSPIHFALLRKFDGRLTLTAGSLRLPGLRLGKTVLDVALAGGLLTARLDPIALYGGTGRVELEVDGRGNVPRFHDTLNFDKVSLLPLLNDMLGLDSIEGMGSLNLEVTSEGASADAVMHALSGKGAIAGTDGRFRGVDLGLVARTIQTVLGGKATGKVASTPFHDMGGNFVIARGVLTNNDFRLTGPVIEMTGSGNVDIGNRTVDFRLVPKTAKIGIPFRVKGSWDHVHYVPDIGGMLGGVIDNLGSGRAPFKGLFGGGGSQKGENGKKKSTGDALKDLFGGH